MRRLLRWRAICSPLLVLAGLSVALSRQAIKTATRSSANKQLV